MAFFGFQKTPSGVTTEDQAQAERSAAWQDLRRSGDLGNVLLNFGLNMMANSETQGLGAAAGGAGLNALNDYRHIAAARRMQANAMQEREDQLKQQAIQNEMAERRYSADREDAQWSRGRDLFRDNLEVIRYLDGRDDKNRAYADEQYKEMLDSWQKAHDAWNLNGRKGPEPQKPVRPYMPSSFSGQYGPTFDRMPGSSVPGRAVGFRGVTTGELAIPEGATVPGLHPRIAEMIKTEALRQGVDPVIAQAVAMQESGGNHMVMGRDGVLRPNTSKAGAVGIMQIMPQFVDEFGGGDPAKLADNIRLGITELKTRIRQNGGNIRSALTSYNWGPGNFAAYRKTGYGVKGQAMPREAAEYADRVFGRMAYGTPTQDHAIPSAIPNADVLGGLSTASQNVAEGDLPAEHIPVKVHADTYDVGGISVTPELYRSYQAAARMGDKAAAKMAEGYEAKKKEAEAPLASKQEQFKQTDRYEKKNAVYQAAGEGFRNVLQYAQDETGASDIALVFAWMKALDPSSVVRESEQEQAMAIGDLQEKAKAWISKNTNGQRLTPAQRKMMVDSAHTAFGNRREELTNYEKHLAKNVLPKYSLDPSEVFYDAHSDLPELYETYKKKYDKKKVESTGGGYVPGVTKKEYARGGAQAALIGAKPIPDSDVPEGFYIVSGGR